VIGEAGIGKTAVVQETIRALIEDDFLDDFTWLQTPRSIDEIERHLSDCRILSLPMVSLTRSISSIRRAVVLDGADNLLYNLNPLYGLMARLGHVIVLLTSRQPHPLGYQTKIVELSQLRQPDAHALIRALENRYFSERAPAITAVEIATLWKRTGGNPRRIHQLVFERQFEEHRIARSGVSKVS
jgi:hypothetical protein